MPVPEDQPLPKVAAELPSYSLEDEEITGWRLWLRGWRLAVALAALAFVTAVAFGAKPLYREAKARRALTIANQAGQAIDRGDSAEASRLLRQAALMAFQDKRVADRVTLHAARAGDMASVVELGKKLESGGISSEESLVYGETMLAAGRPDAAERAATALTDELPPDQAARATALRAGVLQAQQRPDEAKEVLRKAIAEAPGEPSDRLRILLATLLLASREESTAQEAEQLLEKAAENQSEQGASALRLLCANRAGLTPEAQKNLEETGERLRNHPAAKEEDEVFLARLAMASDPARSQEVARGLVTRLRERQATGVDTRVAAARLLIGANQLDAVLELVSDYDASTHAGALMARLDALSGLQDWEQTSALIEKNKGGTLPDTLYHLFRARMALERNDEKAAEDEKRILRQVMGFAEPPHVLFAARYAETVGWKPEALAAWRILAANEGARPDALRAQLRNLPTGAPATEGLAIAEELLALTPEDPSARLSTAYYRLVANKEPEAAAAVAEEFLASNPDSEDFRRVAALGRLRAGKARDGLEIWPGDGGENRWRALHVALLRASGQSRAASEAEREVEVQSLAPEEKELMSGKAEEGQAAKNP